MKLSAGSEYGLKALADLALNLKDKPVSVASIAERQNIPLKYLELVFSSLRRAGLVRSLQGTGGGYILARPAAEIRLSEILKVLEGDLSIVEEEAGDSNAESLCRCIKENVWDVVSGRIYDVLDSMSLQDLIDNKCEA
ncbi:MAG: RrF2 family transcriptional regulator [Burkholderiales bacterium]